MHEQSWKVQKPGPAKVEDWEQNATTRLNCMLCNWIFVIKVNQFFTDFHMKNNERLNLLVREITPDVKIVIKLRKNQGTGQEGTSAQRKAFGPKNMLGQRNKC